MATTTPTPVADRWVVCDEYADGPHTEAAAIGALGRCERSEHCALPHRIVTSATKPVTVAELQVLRKAWDHYDPEDDSDRGDETRELAAVILAAPLGTPVGNYRLVSGGWSRETAEHADATAKSGTPAWYAALGPREHATLTSDGQGARRDAWCRAPETVPADVWVAYEAWTAEGRIAHGFVCPACRKLVQTG